ncbi:hypothetical protein HDV02_000716 [Globomyces sp. JEL0801]|nr:hypothetical protein HDV02_000716 [Globomyces sp. JEL0801]
MNMIIKPNLTLNTMIEYEPQNKMEYESQNNYEQKNSILKTKVYSESSIPSSPSTLNSCESTITSLQESKRVSFVDTVTIHDMEEWIERRENYRSELKSIRKQLQCQCLMHKTQRAIKRRLSDFNDHLIACFQ